MFRYVFGPLSLRSLFPMSTPSELLSGYGRGEVSYNDMITRTGAILRRQGLGTTPRVHNGDPSGELGSCCTPAHLSFSAETTAASPSKGAAAELNRRDSELLFTSALSPSAEERLSTGTLSSKVMPRTLPNTIVPDTFVAGTRQALNQREATEIKDDVLARVPRTTCETLGESKDQMLAKPHGEATPRVSELRVCASSGTECSSKSEPASHGRTHTDAHCWDAVGRMLGGPTQLCADGTTTTKTTTRSSTPNKADFGNITNNLEIREVKDFELTNPRALSHRAQTACGRPAAPQAEERTEDIADKTLGEIDDKKAKNTRSYHHADKYTVGGPPAPLKGADRAASGADVRIVGAAAGPTVVGIASNTSTSRNATIFAREPKAMHDSTGKSSRRVVVACCHVSSSHAAVSSTARTPSSPIRIILRIGAVPAWRSGRRRSVLAVVWVVWLGVLAAFPTA